MYVLLILLCAVVNGDVVRWAVNDSHILENSKICSKKTLVFPAKMKNGVQIASDLALADIALPIFGEILLEDAEIVFGALENDNCVEEDFGYNEKESVYWSDPGVWESSRFNEATPDAERVPCYDDTVAFTYEDVVDLQLPETDQFIDGISFDGLFYKPEHIKNSDLKERLKDQDKTFTINSELNVGLILSTPCKSRSGCPCQMYPLLVDCNKKKCPVLSCAYPVKPIGSCCEICGGVFAFAVSDTFVLEDFKALVKETVQTYEDNLIYHIGRLPNMVQLVVVDKGDYDGTSSLVVSMISKQIETSWKRGYTEMLVSGSSLANEWLGGKIVVSMFFAVVLVMGGVYVYYYKMSSIQYLFHRDVNLGLMRFQTRTDSVVTLARRDSCAEGPVDNSFRNPMFDIQNSPRQNNEEVCEE